MNQKIKRKKSLWKRMQENRKVLAAESIVLPLVLGILLFICWETQLLHGILHTDTFTLPLPSRIANIMGDNVNKIMANAWATVFVALVGLAVIAVIAALFPRWGSSGVTIVAAFNAIPIVALAPVMTN